MRPLSRTQINLPMGSTIPDPPSFTHAHCHVTLPTTLGRWPMEAASRAIGVDVNLNVYTQTPLESRLSAVGVWKRR
jgi:hypothetical protein